ncbi:DUF501 domain-containing protein [Thermotoga sp. KOL6]|uniref:DUF501 domain-containing protein n=1 Tax=Thermotoga sp. KOL6 TaxID=126741 RepID=UPI0035156056
MKEVVFRCPFGYPVVVESFPIKDGKPFPTLYWLTCPHLRKEVSRIESEGFIRKIEERISRDRNFYEKMKRAHIEIIKRREKLLPIGHPFREVLKRVGTGGIKDFSKLKCLHLHLADYLAGVENPVGKMIWDLIENKFCENGICKTGEAEK